MLRKAEFSKNDAVLAASQLAPWVPHWSVGCTPVLERQEMSEGEWFGHFVSENPVSLLLRFAQQSRQG